MKKLLSVFGNINMNAVLKVFLITTGLLCIFVFISCVCVYNNPIWFLGCIPGALVMSLGVGVSYESW